MEFYVSKNGSKFTLTLPWWPWLLQLAFVILKFFGIVAWSWFWVLSPALFYGGVFGIFTVFVVLVLIFG